MTASSQKQFPCSFCPRKLKTEKQFRIAENKTVPSDWMFGVSRLDNNRRRFKSPEGFVFESRVKALEFMINSDTAVAVLATMRLNLSDEGWYSDKSCPGKWKLRKIPGMD